MIPILYEATETEFETNGLGRLSDVITCTVTEARNGQYDLEMTYPVTGIHYDDIAEERIILARPYDGGRPQPFDISYISKPINGIVTIRAQHVSYRLAKMTVAPFSASSPTEAMQKIQRGIIGGSPFTFSTDKVTAGTIDQTIPIACRSLLGGVDGSLLDVFGGGEYEFDRFSVRLWEARGNDNGVTIRYGKDLTGLEDELDIGDVYTSIVPYWAKDDVTVIGDRVESDHAGDYAHQKCIPMDFSADYEEAPTKEQLETAARSYMKNNSTWAPSRNVEISFQPLWQTEEYKDTAVLQRVRLCDTVTVVETLRYFTQSGVKAIVSEYTAKVIKTVFDGLAERYEAIEVGDARTTLADAVTQRVATKEDVKRERTARQELAAQLQKRLAESSGFYTTDVVQPDESIIRYVHDKPTLEASKNVIKVTAEAIGFSTDGGQTYPFGLTVDGKTIMDIVASEGVVADWIQTGILQSADGETFFCDLDNGILRMKATELTIAGQSVNQALSNAVTGVQQQFYLSTSSENPTGGKWSDTQPPWEQGKFIWSRQYVTYGDGNHAYLPSEKGVCITGNTGEAGTDGTNGVGVESVDAEYCVTKSESSAAGGNWSTTMPTVKDGEYIWSRQKVTYSDGSIGYTEAYCMSKTVGDIAQQKVDAQTQIDIFNKLTNNGALEGLFMRDGNLYINASYLVSGILKSLDGTTFFLDLVNGILKMNATELTIAGHSVNDAMSDAITGAVQQFYLSTSPTEPTGGKWSNTQPEWTQGKYIWNRQYVTYGDGTSEYTPSEDGVCITGNTGKDGADGTSGTSSYTHIRYSANADGAGFVADPTASTKYIGIYTGTSQTAPANKEPYTWSKYMGDNGADGKDGNGIRSISYFYAATSTQTPPAAADITGTTIPALSETNKYLWQKEVIDFTDESVADKTTVILLAVYGDKGKDGTNGTNGTSVSITATSITYQASDSGTITPSGNWSGTVPPVNNGQYLWTKTVVTYSDGTSTTAYSVAYKGTNGTDGENGVSIESVTAEYIQSPSATSPDEDPMAQWSADIPEVLPGRYIWTRQKIVYSTGAVEYAGLYCMTKTMGDIAKQKVDEQTQMDIFNKLTNNGALQGVFMRDGMLYVNAQYLRGDTIDLNLLRLAGTLCGLMQGTGATTGGQTTQGIVLYGNGLDAAGNANPPYIIVTNAGVRAQVTKDYSFEMGGNTFDVNGNLYAKKSGSVEGEIWADGNAVVFGQLHVGGQRAIIYENNTGQNLTTLANNNVRSWLAGWQVYVGEDVNGYETHLRGGSIYASKGIQVNSDRRLKKDIEPLDAAYARALDKMTPVRYRYRTDPDDGPYRLGYVAQDVKAALEAEGLGGLGLVGEYKDEDGNARMALDYDELIAMLHMKINSLEAEIKQIKEEMKHGA